MKILVISDSHGHIANLKAAMEIGKKAGARAVIHCGDWADLKSFDTVLSYGLPVYSVLGNADIDPDLEEALRLECKKYDSHYLKFKLDGRRIGVIHNLKSESDFSNLDIVFNGDWHSKEEKMINFTKFVRPGAIENGINLALYETINNEAEFINEETAGT